MQPSDFPTPFNRSFGSPRQRPTSKQVLVLCRPRVRLPTRGASETGHRLSVDRGCSRRGEDLPGYWAVLFVRAVATRSLRLLPHFGYDLSSPLLLFEKIYGEAVIAFTENRTLGIRNVIVFEAVTPRLTRSRAYASPASLPRPSPGSLPARAGSPLAGRVLHPLDDESKFHGVIASPPIPLDQQSLVALCFLCSRARREIMAGW